MLKYKVAKSFPDVAQKVTTAVYAWKCMVAKQHKKSKYILATFVSKFVNKNLQISPNPVSLITSKKVEIIGVEVDRLLADI